MMKFPSSASVFQRRTCNKRVFGLEVGFSLRVREVGSSILPIPLLVFGIFQTIENIGTWNPPTYVNLTFF
jgi:hypothetical protein